MVRGVWKNGELAGAGAGAADWRSHTGQRRRMSSPNRSTEVMHPMMLLLQVQYLTFALSELMLVFRSGFRRPFPRFLCAHAGHLELDL